MIFIIILPMSDKNERVMYHLANCKTCQRIIEDLQPESVGITLVNVKPSIDPAVIDRLAEVAGSYEILFSRRSLQYRKLGLHEQELGESDYRKYMIEHYSFLKRPVTLLDGNIFIGSAKKEVEALRSAIDSLR